MGRKLLMALSGFLFVASIPMIALSHGYGPLVFGRLLQGVSAGPDWRGRAAISGGVPVGMNRGKGTGVFQWLLTLGIFIAAAVGMFFSYRVDEVAKLHDAGQAVCLQEHRMAQYLLVSLPPGFLFVIGSFMVAESPRWLFRRGKRDAAYAALLRSRTKEQADLELQEMEKTAAAEKARLQPEPKSRNRYGGASM